MSRTFLLERFQPQAGFGDVLGVQGAQISPHLQPQVSFFASYADVPLRATTVTDSGVRRTLAASQTTFTLGGSVGFLNRFEVGAAIPIVVTQQVGAGIVDPGLAVGGSTVALSDLRLQGKVRIIDVGSFSFAASLPVTLPTAGNAAYAGYAGATATPTAIAQWRGPRRSAVLLDLGVALRQPQQLLNLTVGSAFTWAVGGKVDLLPRFNITALGSIGGEVGFLKPSAVQSPLEALVAVKWKPLRSLALTLGAGPGLSPGYGTPRFRILASLGWVPGDDEPYEKPAPLPPPPAPVAKAEPAPAPVPAQAEVAAEPEPVAAAPAPAAEEVKPTPPPEAAAAAPARAFQTLDKVYFATARAEVLPGSLHVLDDVARVMKEDASIAKVRIEAHTDNSAPAAYNQKLSADRAEWVRAYLIQHGVDASRLEAQGFGLSRPLVPNLTVQGKATNRRVEFIVVE
ncbi:MAG: OmpA family protein [Archangiaceae bacterium]|nr:OmpA family protein [Archangiaceae bacterium]